jgi:hypothetical protein
MLPNSPVARKVGDVCIINRQLYRYDVWLRPHPELSGWAELGLYAPSEREISRWPIRYSLLHTAAVLLTPIRQGPMYARPTIVHVRRTAQISVFVQIQARPEVVRLYLIRPALLDFLDVWWDHFHPSS